MKCQICHCVIEYRGRGRPPLYCKDCAYLVQLDQMRLHSFLKRQHRRQERFLLGTSNFDQHRNNDFGVEINLVKKQIYKIGFKRQFT